MRGEDDVESKFGEFSVIRRIQDCDAEALGRKKKIRLLDFAQPGMSTTPRLLVVIATYNEMENLPRLVRELTQLISDVSIVVVDDNSPDGTGKWCEEQARQNEHLHFIGRPGKLGLGSATMEGLKFGRDRGFSFVATMDADFSHAPQSMAAMWNQVLERVQNRQVENFGAIIGSRYINGGGVQGWAWYRRFTSRIVNRMTRMMLRLPTRDNTGAFRIYQTDALIASEIYDVQTSGFAYLEELVYLLHRAGFDLHEFPITFVDRTQGRSKASVFEGVKVVWNLLRLRFKT